MANFFTDLFSRKDKVISPEEAKRLFMPQVRNIITAQEQLKPLSDDGLRQASFRLQEAIKSELAPFDVRLQHLLQEINENSDLNIAEKNKLILERETLKKERYKHLQTTLDKALVQAFAIVRETARRFKEQGILKVTATDLDIEIALSQSYVKLEGKIAPQKTAVENDVANDDSFVAPEKWESAIWSCEWEAVGSPISWKMEHLEVQLMAGIALHQGKIAEMDNGEGKTLVVTLPAYLNALSGEGVHIITANSYLARRDSEWMAPIFQFLGMRVGCLEGTRPHSAQRKAAYLADITYGTMAELGFDYLRDNMVTTVDDLVQRGFHCAIVDEVDYILIDEARTPLIISGPVNSNIQDNHELFSKFQPLVAGLVKEQMGTVQETIRNISSKLSDATLASEIGYTAAWLQSAAPNFRPVKQFMQHEGVQSKMHKWLQGQKYTPAQLYEAIDGRMFYKINLQDRTAGLTELGKNWLAEVIGDPEYFNIPNIIEQIDAIDFDQRTLTVKRLERKKELLNLYKTKTDYIKIMEQLVKANTIFENDNEYIVVDGEVKIVDEQTGRVMEGRRYSDGLHQAIEAKENVKVGTITQTYATITIQNFVAKYLKLSGMTGTASTEAKEFWEIYKLQVCQIPPNRSIIRKDEEDLVYKTVREKYSAVIDEIIKIRSTGRPILIETTSVEISELLSRMLKMRGIDHNVLNAKHHQREAEIVELAGYAGAVTVSTKMAGRGTDIKLGSGVQEAGGLAIIGTERHESRRVDRQLRGRAGRQGDPGSSQFYVSLEDSLMRMFQSDRIADLMDKMGHKEGDVIQHSMVTASIERAQKKVEENNFGIRRRLYEYDSMLNIQRNAIYDRRQMMLTGERIEFEVMNIFYNVCEQILGQIGSEEEFSVYCQYTFGYQPQIEWASFCNKPKNEQAKLLFYQVYEQYLDKMQVITQKLLPIIKDVNIRDGHKYKRIIVPIAFPSKDFDLNVSTNMEHAIRTNGKSIGNEIAQVIGLAMIDDIWKEHLLNMDEIKNDVQNMVKDKDPLLVYKKDAFDAFQELLGAFFQNFTRYLCTGVLNLPEENAASSDSPDEDADED